MNKLLGGSLGVIAVAALGVSGAAYWSGIQIERWYQEALAASAQQTEDIKLTTVRYQRGLFSSQVTTAVRASAEDGTDLSFAIHQQVYHGPLPFAGGGMLRLGMGTVRTTLDLQSSAWTRQLGKWYGNQEPIVALSQIDFAGDSTTTITMPPLRLENTEDLQKLDYAGLQGNLRIAAQGAEVQGNFQVASLEITGKPQEGATSGDLVELRDLQANINQRQGAFGLLFGESTFNLAKLHIQDPGQAPFSISALKVSGALTQQSPQLVAAEFRATAAQVSAEQQQGSANLLIALRNLDGATVAQLQKWQEKMTSAADGGQNVDEGVALLKALLTSKPQFSVDAQATTQEGASQVQITLNFQDFDSANVLQNPMTLLGGLETGSADFAAPKTLVEQILVNQTLEQLTASADGQGTDAQALETQAAAQVDQEIKQWLAAGFIKFDANRYVSNVRFADGKLAVNGQNIPLPTFQVDADEQQIPMEPDGGATEEAPQTDAPAAAEQATEE